MDNTPISTQTISNLFNVVSGLLNKPARLVLYSELTQNMSVNPHDILWDRQVILELSDEMLREFYEALARRKCSFYKLNAKLPYHLFCIALLSSYQYSLNHKVTPAISSRSYISAWRAIDVISINNPMLSSWLKKHAKGRTSAYYAGTLGVVLSNTVRPISALQNPNPSPSFTKDDVILSIACDTDEVITIENSGNSSSIMDISVSKSSATIEGQLYNLFVVHDYLANKH